MLFVISLSIVAYLLGSAPWGLVIARVFCGIDPRTAGSRNTGATNVARLCGFAPEDIRKLAVSSQQKS